MNHILKVLLLVSPVLLAGCVSIELPHLVQDTAKVSKDAYQALTAKRGGNKQAAISHFYIGNNNQTALEIKQHCETEAAQKLRQMHSGSAELRYTILANDIVIMNGNIAANCSLAPAM